MTTAPAIEMTPGCPATTEINLYIPAIPDYDQMTPVEQLRALLNIYYHADCIQWEYWMQSA